MKEVNFSFALGKISGNGVLKLNRKMTAFR